MSCQTTLSYFISEIGGRAPQPRPRDVLVLLFASLLTASLPCQRFFYALPLSRLQIERVTFHFLDDVLGLYLALEPAQRVLEGFPLLKSNFSHWNYTPLLVLAGPV